MLLLGLRRKQLQGLMMIRDGMRVQEEHFRARMEWLEAEGKISAPNYIHAKACHHTVCYWLEEVEKALCGDLHF